MFAILSSKISEKFYEKTKINVLSLPPYDRLDEPVSTHADMLISVIENTLFTYEDYYFENEKMFEKLGSYYKVVKVKHKCAKKYPEDIGLNVLVVDKKIFANLKNTAKEIIDFANENGYRLINVNQGYAACSTLALNGGAITSDISTHNALLKEGINSLLISTNGINLPGYNCGFFGGATGVYDDKIYVFGSLKSLPDNEKIFNFISELNYKVVEILPEEVYDFGGIKPIS